MSGIYENDEIKAVIPATWKASAAKGALLLTKEGYVLRIACNTQQTRGIMGGRFIEVFSVPWLDTDDGGTCSMYVSEVPQPASRALLFINMILQTGDSNVSEHCGIRKDLGRRWFAGYLSTASNVGFSHRTATPAAKKFTR